jgi:hypothetical protein
MADGGVRGVASAACRGADAGDGGATQEKVAHVGVADLKPGNGGSESDSGAAGEAGAACAPHSKGGGVDVDDVDGSDGKPGVATGGAATMQGVVRPTVAPVVVRDAGGGKGRGVFALAPMDKGVVVEVAPVLIMDAAEFQRFGKHTLIAHYTFRWARNAQAIALGCCGSMFNHSRRPNVGFLRREDLMAIEFVTVERVEAGDELCISYGSAERLWFDAAGYGGDDTTSDSDGEFFCGVVVDDD